MKDFSTQTEDSDRPDGSKMMRRARVAVDELIEKTEQDIELLHNLSRHKEKDYEFPKGENVRLIRLKDATFYLQEASRTLRSTE